MKILSKPRYVCDRCGIVKHRAGIYSLGFMTQWPVYKYGSVHLCQDCYEKIDDLIDKFMEEEK